MSPPHRVRAPTAPVPKEPLPSPREPGLSFRQGARTRRGPGHEDARRRLAKTLPRGERSGRFLPNGVSSLPEQLRTTRKNLTACPPKKKTPFPMHPLLLGSRLRTHRMPSPPLTPLPDCPSVAAAGSERLPKELPLSIFLLTGRAGARILPVSRNPAPAGGRAAKAGGHHSSLARRFCLGSRGKKKKNRSYFRLYSSGESPRPSAGSKRPAGSQGLTTPPPPPICPLCPLRGRSES